jgi:hypothetical protein
MRASKDMKIFSSASYRQRWKWMKVDMVADVGEIVEIGYGIFMRGVGKEEKVGDGGEGEETEVV